MNPCKRCDKQKELERLQQRIDDIIAIRESVAGLSEQIEIVRNSPFKSCPSCKQCDDRVAYVGGKHDKYVQTYDTPSTQYVNEKDVEDMAEFVAGQTLHNGEVL